MTRLPSGFYFHERCFISIVEAEVVEGLERAALLPSPPGCVRLPYLYNMIAGGRRRRGRHSLPFLSSLRPSHPHKRNAVDLPTGRAPLVRRLPFLDFSCANRRPVRSFGTPKMLIRRSSLFPTARAIGDVLHPWSNTTWVCFRVGFPCRTARSYRKPPTIAKRLLIPCVSLWWYHWVIYRS